MTETIVETGIDRPGRFRNRIVRTGAADPTTLMPHPQNWRMHPESQRDALRGVLEEVGWVQQIIVNETTGHLLDGHLRVELALMDGERTVPVSYTDLTEDEERIILATFDPITSMALLNAGRLQDLMQGLQASSASVNALLDSLRAGAEGLVDRLSWESHEPTVPKKEPKPDPGPQLDTPSVVLEKWGVEGGDLWEVPSLTVDGQRHRLYCGDALDDRSWMELFTDPDDLADMLVTSPPYWTLQDYDDAPGLEAMEGFMQRFAATWKDRVRRRIVINTGGTTESQVVAGGRKMVRVLLDAMWTAAFSGQGWDLRHRRIWVKDAGVGPHTAPIADMVDHSCEMLLTYWRAGHPEGGMERVGEPWAIAGWWQIPGFRPAAAGIAHPCPYPVEIPLRFIRLYSEPAGVVIDPFLGAGTTVVAAEQVGRVCYGTELEPKYLAATLERLEQMGLTPMRV